MAKNKSKAKIEYRYHQELPIKWMVTKKVIIQFFGELVIVFARCCLKLLNWMVKNG